MAECINLPERVVSAVCAHIEEHGFAQKAVVHCAQSIGNQHAYNISMVVGKWTIAVDVSIDKLFEQFDEYTGEVAATFAKLYRERCDGN